MDTVISEIAVAENTPSAPLAHLPRGTGEDKADDSHHWLPRLFHADKLPMILQAEAAECGLACLAMVAAANGQRHTLSDLRRKFSASLKGTTLKSVMDMADGLGMVGRPLRLEVEELASLKPPCILHWNLAHYVVLKKAWKGTGGVWAIIHDPARGVRKVAPAEINRAFTGVALELTPTPAFVRKSQVERVKLSDLWSHMSGLKLPVIQLFALALVMQVFGVFSPMLNQMIIDDAINKGDLDLLSTIGMGMIILMLIQTGIGLIQGFVGMYLGTQLSFQMQSNLLRHALRLPVSWFEKRHIGDIMSRFSSLGPVQSFLTSVPIGATLNVLMLIVGGTMAVLYSPLLFGCVIASMAIPLIAQGVTFPWVRRKTDEGISLGAVASTTFMETLRGARTFKLFGKERDRDPTILFLDEGTANLDPETEKKVAQTLRSLTCTRIFVAHREAAIEGADRLLLVSGGTVTDVTPPVAVAAE